MAGTFSKSERSASVDRSGRSGGGGAINARRVAFYCNGNVVVILKYMKIRIGIFALFVLMLAPLASGAVQRIRARPVLKADKEYNAILLHVAQYFVLTIPDGKTVDDIDHAIQCTFVIAPDGSLTQLQIENDTEGVSGLFAGAAVRRTETWLRNAVLDGMHVVPPFDMTQIRASRSAKKRTIVFSFGRPGSSANNSFMGFNSNALNANVNQSVQEQMQAAREGKNGGEMPKLGMTRQEAERRYHNGAQAWAGFTDENIRSTMKPSYNPSGTGPLPIINTPPKIPTRNDSIPQIDIAISLQ